jgi:hypothetical protein
MMAVLSINAQGAIHQLNKVHQASQLLNKTTGSAPKQPLMSAVIGMKAAGSELAESARKTDNGGAVIVADNFPTTLFRLCLLRNCFAAGRPMVGVGRNRFVPQYRTQWLRTIYLFENSHK